MAARRLLGSAALCGRRHLAVVGVLLLLLLLDLLLLVQIRPTASVTVNGEVDPDLAHITTDSTPTKFDTWLFFRRATNHTKIN